LTDDVIYVALAASLLAFGLAVLYARYVAANPTGNKSSVQTSAAIRQGAMAFLGRLNLWVAIFVAAVAIPLGIFLPWGGLGALAFVWGAILAAGAGSVGLRVSTAANDRTAEAARLGGAARAFSLAFRGGAVTGFSVAAIGLLGFVASYLVGHVWLQRADWPQILGAVGFGTCSVAFFARLAGGIFTKAVDIGADLTTTTGSEEIDGLNGEEGLNPAVIADYVGDNVGDAAGLGADLIDSYIGALVGPIVYASLAFAGTPFLVEALTFPLAVAALGLVASILASFLIAPRTIRLWGDNLGFSLRATIGLAAVATALGVFPLSSWIFNEGSGVVHPSGLALSVLVGLTVGVAIGRISEWFTSDHFKVVKEVARNAQSGAATVLISGLAEGMRSSAYSVLAIAAGVVGSYAAGDWAMGPGGGMYGVAVAAIGVLATLGISLSVYAYGPIADNAGGIAEMAHLPVEARQATDTLDSLGNTANAVAKGHAIGAASMTALALYAAFTEAVALESINLVHPATVAGLFVGGMFPFLLSAFTMNAVGRTAQKVIEEVRRPLVKVSGLEEGRSSKEDLNKGVGIATAGALREMIVPGLLTLTTPVAIGFIDVEALGGFLAGAIVTGFLLAIFMANAGGAWDNAKNFVEAGAFGGRDSDAHRATLIGDMVGDPFKDAAGPAINVVIKLMAMVSLIFAPSFVG